MVPIIRPVGQPQIDIPARQAAQAHIGGYPAAGRRLLADRFFEELLAADLLDRPPIALLVMPDASRSTVFLQAGTSMDRWADDKTNEHSTEGGRIGNDRVSQTGDAARHPMGPG